MSDSECGRVRELIPDFVRGGLGEDQLRLVERHVARCDECCAELELAEAILASRPSPPPQLVGRITRALLSRPRAPARTWWGVSAAAIAALALGIGIASERASQVQVDVPGFAYETDEGEVWSSDDGLVAGAPFFDELSDDALLELLDELSSAEPAGGSA